MVKVIAVHEIHRTVTPGKAATKDTPAVKPVVKVIKPGTVFNSEGDELAQLLSGKHPAVRRPDQNETVRVPLDRVDEFEPGDDDPKAGSNTKKAAKKAASKKASSKKAADEGAGAGDGDGDGAGAGDAGNAGSGADDDLV